MIRLPFDNERVPVAILAAGDYPSGRIASSILTTAEKVVCCDGAAAGYIDRGGRPYAIVGDCDSIPAEVRERYSDAVRCVPDQETNDLTKAVGFCVDAGYGDITIVGATGKREDHTVANISLLAEYAMTPGVKSVRLVTDRAVFDAIVPGVPGGYADFIGQYDERGLFPELEPEEFVFESYAGQQVSIFTPVPGVRITTGRLAYPLHNVRLRGWWSGTLNESESDAFSIVATGPAIICRVFEA